MRATTSAWWTSRSIHGGCDDVVAEHLTPPAERLVGGEDQAGAFVAGGDESEEQVGGLGILPVAADAAEGLYRLVDAAYEKRSVAVSSKLHPSGFDELMPKTMATATVDRLLHHAHDCQTSGDSVRPTQTLAGPG